MVDDAALNDNLNLVQPSAPIKTINIKVKCGIAFAFVFSFFLYRLLYKKYMGQDCVIDKYHQFTYPANRKLYNGWDNTIIGIGQLLMDGWVLFTAIYWFVNCKNMRFPAAIGVYFVFRAFLLNMEKFPFPQDIVWHTPGFAAITVPYDHTRDFFYSGHTGTLTTIALQFWVLKKKIICASCIVSLIYMVNMLTITRIHYSIDIVGALIFAPLWFRVIRINLTKFDYGFSIFFVIGRKIYRKFKKDQSYEVNTQVEMKEIPHPIKQSVPNIKDKEINMNDEFQHQNDSDMPYLDAQNFSQKTR